MKGWHILQMVIEPFIISKTCVEGKFKSEYRTTGKFRQIPGQI